MRGMIRMRKRNIIAATGLIAAALLASGLGGCASCSRAAKTLESDVSGGMQRTVEVYTNTGELLTTYEGKIDIQYEDNRTLFDLDGKRYTINGGIVIVEEE